MKNIMLFICLLVCFFVFIGAVSAEELNLNSVATLSSVIGDGSADIIKTDSANEYTFYYKYVKIDADSFNSYVNAKQNYPDSNEVIDYESTFKSLIPVVGSSDVLSEWNVAIDGMISLSSLDYSNGSHNGYVLTVAAVKDGDASVYVSRVILESKSASSLGEISFSSDVPSSYDDEDVVSQNPDTGLNDYVLYIAPLCIVLGSVILFRKSYA